LLKPTNTLTIIDLSKTQNGKGQLLALRWKRS